MNRNREPMAVGLDGTDLVARYEELRQRALERDVFSGGGLAVLLRQGMAAWVDAWSTCPASANVAPRGSAACSSLPGALVSDLVLVLTEMALGVTRSEVVA